MNTHASTVEDMNILQIIERLSMSYIESSGKRFSIFRNRSFTLFRNERDFGEKSDSASVSESISISMTNLLDTGLTVLVLNISPDFLTWEDHLSSLFHSEEFDELASITGLSVPVCCTLKKLRGTAWLSELVFKGFQMKSRQARSDHTASRYQFRHRLWFCCDSFFTCTFLCSFRHRFDAVDGAEMANVEQTQKMVPLITCEISLYQYVCELVFGVNDLIWILGFELILSNNQSRATLWVLETCLNVGLLPFNDHLDHCFVVFKEIQHSFLTKRIRVWRKTKSTLFGSSIFPRIFFRVTDVDKSPCTCLLWFVIPWVTVTIRSHKSSAEKRPSLNLQPRKLLLILLSCAKLKCVSYTSS